MNIQYINDDKGRPLYALVPVAEFERLTAEDERYWEEIPVESDAYDNIGIPHEIISIMVSRDISIAAAWRIHRGMSQAEAAAALGITQSALSQIEKKGNRAQEKTREQLAAIYQCQPEQLAG